MLYGPLGAVDELTTINKTNNCDVFEKRLQYTGSYAYTKSYDLTFKVSFSP